MFQNRKLESVGKMNERRRGNDCLPQYHHMRLICEVGFPCKIITRNVDYLDWQRVWSQWGNWLAGLQFSKRVEGSGIRRWERPDTEVRYTKIPRTPNEITP